ncbi:hypothetical protein acdb102_16060 [Acidothermaceae bacterium B102]|nr:hypothetical protein acdb102_16060 [Acidothermaceae bacterium B102]
MSKDADSQPDLSAAALALRGVLSDLDSGRLAASPALHRLVAGSALALEKAAEAIASESDEHLGSGSVQ